MKKKRYWAIGLTLVSVMFFIYQKEAWGQERVNVELQQVVVEENTKVIKPKNKMELWFIDAGFVKENTNLANEDTTSAEEKVTLIKKLVTSYLKKSKKKLKELFKEIGLPVYPVI